MWQRIATTKTAAAVATGVVCCTAMTSRNAPGAADAFSPQPSNADGLRSLKNGAYAAFCDATAVHRSSCESAPAGTAAAAAPPSAPAPSFLASLWSKASSSLRMGTSDSRVDFPPSSYTQLKVPEPSDEPQHAVFSTLAGDKRIESYEVYRPPRLEKAIPSDGTPVNHTAAVAEVKFGDCLNGHRGVVHGGILGLVFDDIMGAGCYLVLPPGSMFVTANLNIDYRKPVLENTRVRIEVILDRWEGRKLFWKARMIGIPPQDGEENGEVLYAEATSLYIIPRKRPAK